MEAIFGNDFATGDRAVTGFDFSPIQDEKRPTASRKRHTNEGANKIRRRRARPKDEYVKALVSIAESSRKIANAIEAQVKLDMLNHIHWPLVLEKLQRMGLGDDEIVQVMHAFGLDKTAARMFMSIADEDFTRKFVYDLLGQDPPTPPCA